MAVAHTNTAPFTLDPCPTCDLYAGKVDALVAAGILAADQVPGAPGLPKNSVTFYKGQLPVKRLKDGERDEHYLRVVRCNNRLYVWRGISADERLRRKHGFAPQPELFKQFMDRALEPIGSEEDRREQWADEVWRSLTATQRFSWARSFKEHFGEKH